MNKTFLIGKINLSLIGVLSVAMPFFSFNLFLEKLFRVTLIMSRFGWCKQYYIPIYGIYLCHVCFMTVFFFIVKVANDLCVARSSDQSLIFPVLSPAASFDTDNVPPFMELVLHWTSSAPMVSRFCCFFVYLSHRLYLPSLCCVYPLWILLIKCLSGPLFCISKLAC